jgi:hypothetical protein
VAETGGTGADLVRRRNAATVLRSLRYDGPASRAELAGRTGLAKATVGAIVADLELGGAVRHYEQIRSGDRGRPGVRVTVAGGRPVGIGLEANVEYVAAVVIDLSGAVRHRVTRTVPDVAQVESALARLAAEVAVHLEAEGQQPVGATVAIPGLIAGDDRTIAWTPNLGLTGTSVAALVDEAFGWQDRARLSNDADCAALAELHHGAGRGSGHMLYPPAPSASAPAWSRTAAWCGAPAASPARSATSRSGNPGPAAGVGGSAAGRPPSACTRCSARSA